MNKLILKDVMTVKEIADVLNLDSRTIQLKVKEMFPNKVKNGATTYLSEKEVTAIKLNLEKKFEVKTKLEKALLIQQGYKLLMDEVEGLTEENQQLKAEIEEQKPLVEFAEAVQKSKDGDYIKQFAKTLNPVIGEKRLFAWLREQGILIQGTREPKQEYIDRGYFQMKPSPWKDSCGNEHIDYTPLITGKGQLYIEKKWREFNLQKSA